jgi:S-formylglutathione hydrolase FrmB
MRARRSMAFWLAAILPPLTWLGTGCATVLPPASVVPAPDDSFASKVTFNVPGSSPGATSNALVIVPQDYNVETQAAKAKRYPVVYLLHGHGADYTRFYNKFREVGRPLSNLADRFGMILVTADGKRCSWYLDTPSDMPDAADWQYETIITKHLIPEIDRKFRTWSGPAGRGVVGTSMGGHGALYLAARHPELFGACGSIAGVLNLINTTNPQDLCKRLGMLEQNRARWLEQSAITQCEKLVGRHTAILIDVGWNDPFFWDNRAVHDKLMKLGVAHDYIERAGSHDAQYWVNALPYHLQFVADRLKAAG